MYAVPESTSKPKSGCCMPVWLIILISLLVVAGIIILIVCCCSKSTEQKLKNPPKGGDFDIVIADVVAMLPAALRAQLGITPETLSFLPKTISSVELRKHLTSFGVVKNQGVVLQLLKMCTTNFSTAQAAKLIKQLDMAEIQALLQTHADNLSDQNKRQAAMVVQIQALPEAQIDALLQVVQIGVQMYDVVQNAQANPQANAKPSDNVDTAKAAKLLKQLAEVPAILPLLQALSEDEDKQAAQIQLLKAKSEAEIQALLVVLLDQGFDAFEQAVES